MKAKTDGVRKLVQYLGKDKEMKEKFNIDAINRYDALSDYRIVFQDLHK